MSRIEWTPRALRDLSRLYRFLAPKSPDAGRRAVGAIRQGVKALRAHPEIGRPVEDLPSGVREWLIPFGSSAYVARYRYDGEAVTILAIRHGREAGY